MTEVVRIEGLRKSYQGREVLRGVDLRLEQGRTYFLVGPNGCGKTTTIETLIGLRHIEAGSVRVLDCAPGDPSLRSRIRVCLQGAALHAQVTVREHFEAVAAIYGAPTAQIDNLAQQFGIADLMGRRYGRLSGGQQKRVMVAASLFGEADLIVLDEPTSGVDLESRLSLWASLREAMGARHATLLATTHDLNEAEEYADEVIIMREGTMMAQGPVDELVAHSGLIGVLPVPTLAVRDILGDAELPSRHLLGQDRGTSTLGYTDRRQLNDDIRRLEEHSIQVRERSARLTDAYLFAYRGGSQ